MAKAIDLNKVLEFIPFPKGLDAESYSDWDQREGFGGTDQIFLVVGKNRSGIVVEREGENYEDIKRNIQAAAEFFND